jgi:hypothetical protein
MYRLAGLAIAGMALRIPARKTATNKKASPKHRASPIDRCQRDITELPISVCIVFSFVLNDVQ